MFNMGLTSTCAAGEILTDVTQLYLSLRQSRRTVFGEKRPLWCKVLNPDQNLICLPVYLLFG